jgi:hypothetical protein
MSLWRLGLWRLGLWVYKPLRLSLSCLGLGGAWAVRSALQILFKLFGKRFSRSFGGIGGVSGFFE